MLNNELAWLHFSTRHKFYKVLKMRIGQVVNDSNFSCPMKSLFQSRHDMLPPSTLNWRFAKILKCQRICPYCRCPAILPLLSRSCQTLISPKLPCHLGHEDWLWIFFCLSGNHSLQSICWSMEKHTENFPTLYSILLLLLLVLVLLLNLMLNNKSFFHTIFISKDYLRDHMNLIFLFFLFVFYFFKMLALFCYCLLFSPVFFCFVLCLSLSKIKV